VAFFINFSINKQNVKIIRVNMPRIYLPRKTNIAIWLMELVGLVMLLPVVVMLTSLFYGLSGGYLFAVDYSKFIYLYFFILLFIASYILKRINSWLWHIIITLIFASLVFFVPLIIFILEESFRQVINLCLTPKFRHYEKRQFSAKIALNSL